MPLTPDLPFPKSPADAIRSKDWNDHVKETQRLDVAKVNRSGDAMTGPLTIAGALGIGTTAPKAPLHVVGPALISDGDGFAVKDGKMAKGSLTIGSIASSFGGGTGWNANTAGLMMETAASTEIAVHHSGTRIASIVQYNNNTLTIGRNMGWGPIGSVVLNGNVEIKGRCTTSNIRASVVKTNKVDVTAKDWTAMPDMSLAFTAALPNNFLIIAQINGVQALVPGTPLRQELIASYFRLLVDNGQVDFTRHEFHQNGWELRGVYLSRIVALSPGPHTVAVQWYTTSGTTSACWYGDNRQIQVIEL